MKTVGTYGTIRHLGNMGQMRAQVSIPALSYIYSTTYIDILTNIWPDVNWSSPSQEKSFAKCSLCIATPIGTAC